jgi:Tol biopolymer transport system component/tRNA A-37 threonylcarbamoyl transferase component Bud32
MNPERWRKVEELFHAALERAPEARPAFLDGASSEDADLRRQVELLLVKQEQAGSFLEIAAVEDLTVTAPASLVGRQFGPYRIVSPLGAGGMGEVYRAHDNKLGRDVAIKTLPREFARDPERLARFRREARTLASLNHPNIAAIYGLETGDVDCLVLELVEGETLRGPLPLDKALEYARQIAEASEAAHEKGIIHRDLKPNNVKVTPQGRVKVLDFGLAKAIWGPEENQDLSQLATVISLESSLTGRVLGTPGYMSPEQARGKDVDKRTDIWAFGCLLYELLAGKRAFRGETASDTLAAVLEREPDWQALPAKTPAKVRELLRQCLQKDASRRLPTIADARRTIEKAQRGWSGWRVATVTAAALALLAAGATWVLKPKPAAAVRAEFSRVTSQPGVEWFPSLSRDGKWLVYAADAGPVNRHIYLQSVKGQNPLDLTRDSTANDDQPAFSPDGERIAFRSSRDGGGIFVMGRTGEAVRRVTRLGFNPSWSPDGAQLAFSTDNIELYPQNNGGELWTVTVNAGEARRLLDGDATLPSWSPHTQRIAFTRWRGKPAKGGVWTIPVKGGTAAPVTGDPARDWNPVWSPDGKYLYFVSDRGGSMNLWRVPIDEASGKALAEPEPITTPAAYLAHPSLSADGKHIAYSSVLITANIQQLTLDTSKAVTGDTAWVTSGSRLWSTPDPSPDGEWVVFYSLTQPEGPLYVSHRDGLGLRQVTNDMAINRVPRWSPDGKWIVSISDRSGPMALWKIGPDGSGLQQLTERGGGYYPTWSPDGSRMAAAIGGIGGRDTAVWLFDPNRPWKQETAEVLPDWPSMHFTPTSWSADGEYLAGMVDDAESRGNGNNGSAGIGIATYSLRSHKYERLTNFGQWPAWLPDSRHVLFVAEGKAFFVVDTRSKQVRKIFSVARDVIGPPRLTRNGTKAYYSRRMTESDIWLMTLK